jgi:NNP family nitrate/nitrite transporter-like MFS transporter
VTTAQLGGRWIEHWEPEDESFWERTGKKIATRNLWFSILSEHIGFSIWSIWSVLVLFMGPQYGFDTAQKFYLVAFPTLVGAVLRIPYTFAVARFGGRNWTVISAALLLAPTTFALIVMEPGVSFTTLMIAAAVAGVGGGNFASSMTNINTFYPEKAKGWALGLNAGGGNLGVAVVQLLGLLVIATAGAGSPRVLLWIYVPLILIAVAGAWTRMDNIAAVSNDRGAFAEGSKDRHTWIMSFLYIGTFGSFIGYSFAFGLVLQNQFGRSPLQAAAVTFLGPLIGSLIRPIGGRLADRYGGAKITMLNFVGMAVATGIVIAASNLDSLAVFTIGFVLLFALTGIGNGSTYKMIPAIFTSRARSNIASGRDEATELAMARRISGAVIGIVGAVGALGGVLINLAFRQSFLVAKTGAPAFWSFLVFYLLCMAVTWAVYLRSEPVGADQGDVAFARV